MYYYYYVKADINLACHFKEFLYKSFQKYANLNIEDRQEINSTNNYKPSKVVSLFFFDFSLRSENNNP